MTRARINPAIVCLAVALAAGAYLRFYHLTDQSLFLDEGFSIRIASMPWATMMHEIVYHDFHPPVFYALAHWAIGAFRWQPWDYRYLTAPFGMLTIVASWAIARRLFGDVAAAVTAFLVALEPALVDWDRIFRMYSVMTALATTSWWLILIGEAQTGRRRVAAWLGYGAVAVLLPYVQYLGAVTLLCQGAYALFDIRKRWPVLASCFAAAAAMAPWLWAIRIQYPHGGYVAGQGGVPIYWVQLARDVMLTGLPITWLVQPASAWTVDVALALVAVIAVVKWPRSIVPFWLGICAVQVIATLATGKGLIVPRYLLPVIPGFAVAFGGLIASLLATRLRVAGAVLAAGLPAVLALCSFNIVWVPFYQMPDWYLVNLVVLENERPDDAMLFVQGFPFMVVGNFTAFRGHPAEGPAMPSDVPATMAWIRRHPAQRIWYIENQWYYPDPKKTIKSYLDRTRPLLHTWSEARVQPSDIVNIVLYGPEVTLRAKKVRSGPGH